MQTLYISDGRRVRTLNCTRRAEQTGNLSTIEKCIVLMKPGNLFLMLTAVASQQVFAASVAWPDLSKVCAIKDRPATEMDVKLGCAAFVIKGKDGVAGEPLKLTIPQYALYVDEKTGKETPVVLIQAEQKGGIQAIGYKNAATGDIGAGLLREFRLLGTRSPK